MTLDQTPLDKSEILLERITVPPALNNLFLNLPRGRAITPRYRAWRTAASWEVKGQHPRRLPGPVDIVVTIQDGASKADIDGLLKAPIDLLVELDLIDGDGPTVLRSAKAQYGKCDAMRIEVRRCAA